MSTTRKSLSLESTASQDPVDASATATAAAVSDAHPVRRTPATRSRCPAGPPFSPRPFARLLSPSGVGDVDLDVDVDVDGDFDGGGVDLRQAAASSVSASRSAALVANGNKKMNSSIKAHN